MKRILNFFTGFRQKSYQSFPDMYENASVEEKRKVYYRMAQEANKEQRKLMRKYQ